METSILIAEDDPLLRKLLVTLLSTEPGFTILGAVEGGLEAIEAIGRLQPRVLLLDLGLPGASGIEVLEALLTRADAPAVLVLTSSEEEATELRAARLGAQGFVPKSEAVTELADAIRAVTAGEAWLSRRTMGRILADYRPIRGQQEQRQSELDILTAREKEVLTCVAGGMTNKQIAHDLCMSMSTVKLHVQHILEKLGVQNRAEASVFAVRAGLVGAATPNLCEG